MHIIFEPTNPSTSLTIKSLDDFYKSKRNIERYFNDHGYQVETTGQATENMRIIVKTLCANLVKDNKKMVIRVNSTHGLKMRGSDFFRGGKDNCMLDFNLLLNETSHFDTVMLFSNDFYEQMESF